MHVKRKFSKAFCLITKHVFEGQKIFQRLNRKMFISLFDKAKMS